MDFKTFIANESIALGNLGAKMDRLFDNDHFRNQANSFLNNIEQNPNNLGYTFELPKGELEIPQIERTGRIVTLLDKRNPIFVKLSDGTEASFTYDEWRRIDGNPQLGKVMTIIFQRHPSDSTKNHSKIDKIIVRD